MKNIFGQFSEKASKNSFLNFAPCIIDRNLVKFNPTSAKHSIYTYLHALIFRKILFER